MRSTLGEDHCVRHCPNPKHLTCLHGTGALFILAQELKQNVLATCYKKENEALIAVATWSDKDEKVQLDIDFDRLDIDKDKCKMIQPQIIGFQESNEYPADHEFVIKPRGGFMVIVK